MPNDHRDDKDDTGEYLVSRQDEPVGRLNLLSTSQPVSATELVAALVQSRAEKTALPVDCPESERIWSAVQLQSPLDERLAIIDHLSECPRCAEAWRLGAELMRERDETQRTNPPAAGPEKTTSWRRAILIIAAVALAILVILSAMCPGRLDAAAAKSARFALSAEQLFIVSEARADSPL